MMADRNLVLHYVYPLNDFSNVCFFKVGKYISSFMLGNVYTKGLFIIDQEIILLNYHGKQCVSTRI